MNGKIDEKTLLELSNAFMELFRKHNCNLDDVLLSQWVLDFKMTLSPPENKLFSIMEHDLESKDYFSIEGSVGREQYCLKQAGYDFIYKPVN